MGCFFVNSTQTRDVAKKPGGNERPETLKEIKQRFV
jgi:hypothetical protein